MLGVHEYVSDFYGAVGGRRDDGTIGKRGEVDFRSLDETALIAMGVLLEEMVREVVGETGDLVFTEGFVVGREEDLEQRSDNRRMGKAKKRRRIG